MNKDLRKLLATLSAEGIEYDLRQGKRHLQVYVGGERVFTRSIGSKSARTGHTRRVRSERNALRKLLEARND